MDAGDESMDDRDSFLVLPAHGFGVFGAKRPQDLRLFNWLGALVFGAGDADRSETRRRERVQPSDRESAADTGFTETKGIETP